MDTAMNGFRPTAPIATPDRLAKSSSRVAVRNTSQRTMHIVIDRHYQGKEIKPGETVRDIEMLDEDIRRFMSFSDHDIKIDATGSGFQRDPDQAAMRPIQDATLTDDELRANKLLQKTTNAMADVEDDEDEETPPRKKTTPAAAKRSSGRARL